MADSQASHPPAHRPTMPMRHALTMVVSLLAFHVVSYCAGREDGLWLPALGLGFALVSWFRWPIVPLLMIDLFLVRMSTHPDHSAWLRAVDSGLLVGQMAASWWCFARLAQASRWLDDPRSATVFLLIVPGGLTAAAALIQAGIWSAAGVAGTTPIGNLAGALGISRVLGALTVAPFLLVIVTPLLARRRWIDVAPSEQRLRHQPAGEDTWGEVIELIGLTLGNAILTLALVMLQVQRGYPGWTLWGISLLLVVWTSLRQGLRGGLVAATVGAVSALATAAWLGAGAADFSPLQGNLLAQTSTALLVGASAGWIRASEARYRRVVGHIPVLLYSVRLPVAISAWRSEGSKTDSKPHINTGPAIIEQAEVTLVSPASALLFGVAPEHLEGPFRRWLERVHPSDRELLQAALTQLCLQKQPVTCEYRAVPPAGIESVRANGAPRSVTWVRDTLAPHHGLDGRLDGWDGVVEDITEARALSQSLRRTTGMLQALISNLPMGVFFVQGPLGHPVLVNARARQLLGQREDPSASVAHLAEAYRLHRPDGSAYPADELPVAKALRMGVTCSANDIVVHRPDGRRLPLITWAAPIDLGKMGQADAAVWVLEDWTALQSAEIARRESETRLRAIIESMAEGLLIQNQYGAILECNPAAAALLDTTQAQLIGRRGIGPLEGCVHPDRTPMPLDQQPDHQALRTGQPVRAFVLGLPRGEGIHWLLVNSIPLPVGNVLGGAGRDARLVTTFADITVHRQMQEEMQKAQRLDLMGRLASGTVHDFNNLLTALLGMAALARGGLPPEHPVRADINRIIDIGEQAADLAGQLLAFSKQRLTTPRPVDVNTAIVHTLTILKGVMPDAIRVESRLAPGDLWVLADNGQLQQIFMNLCLNARDAMSEGGRLIVRTSRHDQPDGPWICCAIHDTGCGMDGATRARIFEPFYTTKERGTGLGLAVVEQLVQSFGGRIDVTSEPGHGACLDVWLRECAAP